MEELIRQIPLPLLFPLFLSMAGLVCFAMMQSTAIRNLALVYFIVLCGYELFFSDYNFRGIVSLFFMAGFAAFFFRMLFWLEDNSFSSERIQMSAREFIFGASKQTAELRVTILLLILVAVLLIGSIRSVIHT